MKFMLSLVATVAFAIAATACYVPSVPVQLVYPSAPVQLVPVYQSVYQAPQCVQPPPVQLAPPPVTYQAPPVTYQAPPVQLAPPPMSYADVSFADTQYMGTCNQQQAVRFLGTNYGYTPEQAVRFFRVHQQHVSVGHRNVEVQVGHRSRAVEVQVGHRSLRQVTRTRTVTRN